MPEETNLDTASNTTRIAMFGFFAIMYVCTLVIMGIWVIDYLTVSDKPAYMAGYSDHPNTTLYEKITNISEFSRTDDQNFYIRGWEMARFDVEHNETRARDNRINTEINNELHEKMRKFEGGI